MSAADDQFREEALSSLPRSYSPLFHLLFPSAVGLSLAVVGLSVLRAPTWLDWLTVPAVWVVSNAVEWRAHKDVLHVRRWGLATLFERHTPMHHRVFTTEDMAIRSRREFELVLIPPWGILLIAVAVGPGAFALWSAGHRNVAGLFLATTMLYVVSYEWLHLSYHLPPDSRVGRLAVVQRLKRHHATHHDPSLMQRWNFNVTLPLWDWVRGTIWKPGA
jgi:hypothetical protein